MLHGPKIQRLQNCTTYLWTLTKQAEIKAKSDSDIAQLRERAALASATNDRTIKRELLRGANQKPAQPITPTEEGNGQADAGKLAKSALFPAGSVWGWFYYEGVHFLPMLFGFLGLALGVAVNVMFRDVEMRAANERARRRTVEDADEEPGERRQSVGFRPPAPKLRPALTPSIARKNEGDFPKAPRR